MTPKQLRDAANRPWDSPRTCTCDLPAADICRNRSGNGVTEFCRCLCHHVDNMPSHWHLYNVR